MLYQYSEACLASSIISKYSRHKLKSTLNDVDKSVANNLDVYRIQQMVAFHIKFGCFTNKIGSLGIEEYVAKECPL